MQTMDMCLERLARQGVISPAAGLEKAEDKEAFKKLFPALMGKEGHEHAS